jgi:2-oxoglutarate ferredoxin oxidoreductase subunit gamma
MVDKPLNRSDLNAVYVPANEIARELGDERVVNMIMLGRYARISGAVSIGSLKQALGVFFGGKRASLVEINERALDAGAAS